MDALGASSGFSNIVHPRPRLGLGLGLGVRHAQVKSELGICHYNNV